MKVHRYEVTCYEGILAWTHGFGQKQTKMYIPQEGILGFRSKEEIDFFSDTKESINEAERIVHEKAEEGERYLGEIELPEELVRKVILKGRTFNQAKEDFRQAAKSLIDLLPS